MASKYRTFNMATGEIIVESPYQAHDDLGNSFIERDASYDKSFIQALKLSGMDGEVVEYYEELDYNDVPLDDQFVIPVGDLDDPLFVAFKGGKRVGAFYYTFRGVYQGFLVTADGNHYYTNTWDHSDGSWQETADSVMRESLAELLVP